MRRDRLKIIGITGGMGSGKSTVARIFEGEGLLVVDADMVSRDVLSLYPEILNYIRAEYGKDYFCPDGNLDRRKFGRMIFSDPEKLSEYEKVIMPYIIQEIRERFNYIESATDDEYAVLDAPLLFEVEKEKLHDVSITVETPLELEIQRVMERDGLSRQEVLDRFARQKSRRERELLADFVLINDGSEEDLRIKALEVLERIRKKH